MRYVFVAIIGLTTTIAANAQTVRIGVLGLFHPKQLCLSAEQNRVLRVKTNKQDFILEARQKACPVRITAARTGLQVSTASISETADELTANAREGMAAWFMLEVPEKLKRRYFGVLRITNKGGQLVPVVEMNLEDAVASVVAAESLPGTPIEALKAQAVAVRSFLLAAKGQHRDFDFCDTTHCQFLREIPDVRGLPWKATQATRGLVLTYDDKPIAAMYSASCGGRTHTLREIGLEPRNYPYFAVECPYCRRHPDTWRRDLDAADAASLSHRSERSRLAITRKRGWNAVPSNHFEIRNEGGHTFLVGHGAGHGVGLCERGAAAMAKSGLSFLQILARYYPNTTVHDYGDSQSLKLIPNP